MGIYVCITYTVGVYYSMDEVIVRCYQFFYLLIIYITII